MDYDFITTCNWTSTGTFTLRAYRGSSTDIVTSVSLFYRKKGDANWIETTNGEVVIASTGEWEIANDWNKSGNDCLTHSYYGITAINSCTVVYFDEVSLGTTVGSYFLYACWRGCTNLTSMPSEFNIPSGITTVGSYFLAYCWLDCTNLTSDNYTENITFEFNAYEVFGGTCPLTPDSVTASKETPVNVAVHRTDIKITCETGSFSLTGQPITLKASYKLIAEVGNFALTGFDAIITKTYLIVCETGSFILTGTDTTLKASYKLVCASGSFALTGIAVAFTKTIPIICECGKFILTGVDVRFDLGWRRKYKEKVGTFSRKYSEKTGTFIRKYVEKVGNWTNKY